MTSLYHNLDMVFRVLTDIGRTFCFPDSGSFLWMRQIVVEVEQTLERDGLFVAL